MTRGNIGSRASRAEVAGIVPVIHRAAPRRYGIRFEKDRFRTGLYSAIVHGRSRFAGPRRLPELRRLAKEFRRWLSSISGMVLRGETVMRTLAVSLNCLIASLILFGAASAQSLNLTRSAESGVDSLISQERAWDRNCNALPVTVRITKNPVNVTVSVVPGVTSTIPSSTPASGNAGACAGKTVTGNEIRYKSKAGFHGTDSVSYNIVNGNRPPQSRVITINVK